MDTRLLKYATGTGLTYATLKAVDRKFHISSDVKYIRSLLPILKEEAAMAEDHTFADEWEATHDHIVRFHPGKPALIYAEDGRKYSFEQLEAISNQIAHFFVENQAKFGIKVGDSVAVMIDNRPEFIFVAIGLSKAGMKPAFINTNNKRKPLVHSIEVSHCKGFIYGEEMLPNVASSAEFFEKSNLPLFILKDSQINFELTPEMEELTSKSMSLDAEIKNYSTSRLPKSIRSGIKTKDVYGYIYTSGTTGLPKACVIRHSKMFSVPRWGKFINRITEDDVVYTPLPLYHSAGGLIAFTNLTTTGCTFVIARKFSASKFFKDCHDYGCTVSQYIGETARYLVQAPPSEYDRKHKVRLFIGNGLRREIWKSFINKFNIKHVAEFYGSTEGNVSLNQLYDADVNGEEGIGAVAKVGHLLKKQMKFRIVKHDTVKEEPVRDANGFCIDCASGEPGELLGFMYAPNVQGSDRMDFAGYTTKEATQKKILKDVFQKGDAYFRTGDVVKHDSNGWIYFIDRIGDTFRWKGENVSTNEVSEVVSTFPGVLEANVYGVKVPGNEDGRACMCAIALKEGATLDNFNFRAFSGEVDKSLAKYAKPLFLRFVEGMRQTGTFKQQKVDLVKEGVDLNQVSDPIFVLDDAQGTYVPLTEERLRKIANREAKL